MVAKHKKTLRSLPGLSQVTAQGKSFKIKNVVAKVAGQSGP
jgi:hypothetical protein